MPLDPYQDPRNQPFEIPKEALSPEALDGMIESYCTQYHGLNDMEDPISNKETVRKALEKGALTIWFDPTTNDAAIHPKEGNPFNPATPQKGA